MSQGLWLLPAVGSPQALSRGWQVQDMSSGQAGARGRQSGTLCQHGGLSPNSFHCGPCPPIHPPGCPQENRLAQHTIQALQTELDSLRADNIKLFEKIKFLQSYPGRVSTPHPAPLLPS